MRIPTGISGLDEVLGGGFPERGLVVVAGNPGTGKTILSASFLYWGAAKYGEKGIYVSFAEAREEFFANMRSLGMNFEELEKSGAFRFLDMITIRGEAVPSVMEEVLKEVGQLGARRLVIDSLSALLQSVGDRHDVRILLHTVLNKITKSLGCTTLLVVEVPYGSERIGLGVEEFVADGLLLLRRGELEGGRILREMEIFKMRGTPIPQPRLLFTLEGGFKAFTPFKPKSIERPRRFEPLPDPEGYFSTGSLELDEILGGYPRGSTVLLEIADEHVSITQYHLILAPTAWNFISMGRGVLIVPSRGVDYNLIKRRAKEGGISEEEIKGLLRVCVKGHPGLKFEPWIVQLKGESVAEDHEKYMKIEEELVEKTGQPVACFIGVDTLVDMYGIKDALSILRASATTVREKGGLLVLILKPGYPRLVKLIGTIADTHLKIMRRYGVVLVYGHKPRTPPYVLEMDASKGYPMPKLTRVI